MLQTDSLEGAFKNPQLADTLEKRLTRKNLEFACAQRPKLAKTPICPESLRRVGGLPVEAVL
jgi:hypothetical protein